MSLEEVKENMMKRDKREMGRKIDPLRAVSGAWRLDTTKMEVDEVAAAIVERVEKMRN